MILKEVSFQSGSSFHFFQHSFELGENQHPMPTISHLYAITGDYPRTTSSLVIVHEELAYRRFDVKRMSPDKISTRLGILIRHLRLGGLASAATGLDRYLLVFLPIYRRLRSDQ